MDDNPYLQTVVYDLSTSDSPQQDQCLAVCQACNKTFANKYSLKRHEESTPVCYNWNLITTQEPENASIDRVHVEDNILDILDEFRLKILTAPESKTQCQHCKTLFSNTGNLNKHFRTSVACNKLAITKFKTWTNGL
jgi:hypothetical protein